MPKETSGALSELALFAGAGGGILGGKLLGWRTVCAVERDQYAASVLAQRQNDGLLEAFPIWDDVQTFDGRPWRGVVDVISGGFPCQDISVAGKGAGIDGERSGMWKHMARIIGEVRPRYVFVENSPMLVHRGLARVLGDLAALGYDARWGIIGADDVGAPHRRKRIWIVAHSYGFDAECGSSERHRIRSAKTGERSDYNSCGSDQRQAHVANSNSIDGWPGARRGNRTKTGNDGQDMACPIGERQPRQRGHWFSSDPAETREGETDYAESERIYRIWGIESRLGRVAHGVAHRVDRLKAIGNGQVPAVAALAFEKLTAYI